MSFTWIAGIFLLVASMASSAFAQGSLSGRALDSQGDVLPCALIVASDGTSDERRGTDASGRYEFPQLRAGRYILTASLPGFESQKREAVVVTAGGSIRVDFVLCPASLKQIDWILPDGLEQMFRSADVVAVARIAHTRSIAGPCRQSGFSHDAQVLELLKGTARTGTPRMVTFVQEEWADEQIPYPKGQTMLVLLSAGSHGTLVRTYGPFSVFTIEGDTVTSSHPSIKSGRITASEFLAKARMLANAGTRPQRF